MTQIVKTVVLSKIFTFFVTLISFFFISTARSLIQINSLMYSSESKGMGSPSVDEDEIVHHQEPKSILITGGAGYIATHTIICLLNAGYHVTVVDNLINSSEEGLRRVREITGCENDKIRFYNVDMCNFDALQKIFSESQTKFHSCIHFAGLKAVGESVDKPLLYYKNNLVSTMNLLELMDKHGCHSLVFSSSATVYGTAEVPITEATPTGVGISNPYGKTKHMIEDIIHDFKKSKDLVKGSPRDWSVVILRYFNPVGAHPSGRIGEDPNGPPNNLMPYISQVAVGKRESLTVFGGDYPTKDGTGIRDYIHVMDLAEGHMSALKFIESPLELAAKSSSSKAAGYGEYSVFNLGSGIGYSVLDMVKGMQIASGKEIAYKVGPRREGDVAVCYADCTKAKEQLGWVAKRTLADMCADSWRWQSNNPNGFKK
mmetsp:Transcript_8535/g.11708  ORF Transcript_8535/g.11708 Transcript_8535/m.11708 type:complete len:429 (+) Transcript_8535:23-1309(+)